LAIMACSDPFFAQPTKIKMIITMVRMPEFFTKTSLLVKLTMVFKL